MNHQIRPLQENEVHVLEDFLYEAIFVPEGRPRPSREITKAPELRMYYEDFGTRPGDICFVLEVDNKIVGAAWGRIMEDYGHLDDETPSLSIALYEAYRDQDLGAQLMKQLLRALKDKGYSRASLSVQRANHAAYQMYTTLGFERVRENPDDDVMAINLL